MMERASTPVAEYAPEQSITPQSYPKLSNAERRWSPQEVAVLRCLAANGDTVAELAARMRRTPRSVEDRLHTGREVASWNGTDVAPRIADDSGPIS